MADKPEFVDMISEADAPDPSPDDDRLDRAGAGQGTVADEPLAARPDGAVAAGKPDALEAEILEVQELGLSAVEAFHIAANARTAASTDIAFDEFVTIRAR